VQASKEIEVATAKGPAVFVVPQLDGMRGTKLLIKITKILAPAITQARSADGQAGKGLAALGGILADLDPDEFEKVAMELLAKSVARFPEADEVDDQAGKHLGVIFHGQSLELLKLVGGALEHNFPFVETWIKGMKSSMKAMIPKA
jgi:hypothetical protein